MTESPVATLAGFPTSTLEPLHLSTPTEQQFRRIIGHPDLAKLTARVEREVTLPQSNPAPTEEAAIVAAA
jgi:hypothetical protein